MSNLQWLLERSRELARTELVVPAVAANRAIDELAEQAGSALEEELLKGQVITELSGLTVRMRFITLTAMVIMSST
jgi:predicted alternative tryptophan synthase beta-subunit